MDAFSSGAKLIAPEQLETVVKLFLIDLVDSGNNLSIGCDFFQRAWLGGVDPNDESRVHDGPDKPSDFDKFPLHRNVLQAANRRNGWVMNQARRDNLPYIICQFSFVIGISRLVAFLKIELTSTKNEQMRISK